MKRLIIAASLLAATNAHAEFWTGTKLREMLSEPAGVKSGAAHGYIIGVHDVGDTVLHCSPSDAKAGDVVNVVRIYMDAVPPRSSQSADSVVLAALKQRWPCPDKGRGT
jgi:hypothetical protein